jgi:hypothetical protein
MNNQVETAFEMARIMLGAALVLGVGAVLCGLVGMACRRLRRRTLQPLSGVFLTKRCGRK